MPADGDAGAGRGDPAGEGERGAELIGGVAPLPVGEGERRDAANVRPVEPGASPLARIEAGAALLAAAGYPELARAIRGAALPAILEALVEGIPDGAPSSIPDAVSDCAQSETPRALIAEANQKSLRAAYASIASMKGFIRRFNNYYSDVWPRDRTKAVNPYDPAKAEFHFFEHFTRGGRLYKRARLYQMLN